MKTEIEIKQRVNALKMDLEHNEKMGKLKPFEAGRLNYTIKALEWVLEDKNISCPDGWGPEYK